MKLNIIILFLYILFLETNSDNSLMKKPGKKSIKYKTKRYLQYSEVYINIFDFIFRNNQIVLDIEYYPDTPINFSLTVSIDYETNDESGEWYSDYFLSTFTLDKNNSEYTIIFDNFTLLTFTKLSIWFNDIYSFIDNYIYHIFITEQRLYIINKTKEQDSINNTEIGYNELFLSDLYLDNDQIYFFINFAFETTENISLKLSLYVTAEDYSVSEDIDSWFEVNSDIDEYPLILEKYNPNEINNIYIYDISIDNYNGKNVLYIYYPSTTFIFGDEIVEDTHLIIYPTGYIPTDSIIESDIYEANTTSNGSNRSSSKLSTGIIIVIIVGIIVFIAIIITLIICIRRRLKSNIIENNCYNHTSGGNTFETEVNGLQIINQKGQKDNAITFIFITQNQEIRTLVLEKNKTWKDLRELYFTTINRIDLLNDETIYFLLKAKPFTVKSNDSFEDKINPNEINRVIVIDNEDKLCDKTIIALPSTS